MIIHLNPLLPKGLCCQPGSAGGKAPPGPRPRAIPIWHCSRRGLPCRSGCPSRGGLLPHRFTLTHCNHTEIPCERAVCFLWRCPSACTGRALPGAVSSWSPDFPQGFPRDHPAIRRPLIYIDKSPASRHGYRMLRSRITAKSVLCNGISRAQGRNRNRKAESTCANAPR